MGIAAKIRRSLRTRGIWDTIRTGGRYLAKRLAAPFRGDSRGARPAATGLRAWLSAYRDVGPVQPHDTTFTVVCPVYDTEPEMLDACVRSVLAQSHGAFELLLVDDASASEATRKTLQQWEGADPRIRVLRNERNMGIATTTNRGIDEASGEYIVFLDHDDELAPTALAWCAACTPRADLIYSDEHKIDTTGRPSAPFFKPSWSPRILLGLNYINHLGCIRTELIRRLGGLRQGFDGAQDHDLLLRASEEPITVAHLPNLLYRWRTWAGSTAGNAGSKVEAERAGLRAVQEAIERRGWNASAGLGSGSPFNYGSIGSQSPSHPSSRSSYQPGIESTCCGPRSTAS